MIAGKTIAAFEQKVVGFGGRIVQFKQVTDDPVIEFSIVGLTNQSAEAISGLALDYGLFIAGCLFVENPTHSDIINASYHRFTASVRPSP